jgi:hypothetical protein
VGKCVETCEPGYFTPSGMSTCYKCPAGTYQPESGAGECWYCRYSKGDAATECFDSYYNFNRWALIAFITLGAVGIATFFRRFCMTYDSTFISNKLCGCGLPVTEAAK